MFNVLIPKKVSAISAYYHTDLHGSSITSVITHPQHVRFEVLTAVLQKVSKLIRCYVK